MFIARYIVVIASAIGFYFLCYEGTTPFGIAVSVEALMVSSMEIGGRARCFAKHLFMYSAHIFLSHFNTLALLDRNGMCLQTMCDDCAPTSLRYQRNVFF